MIMVWIALILSTLTYSQTLDIYVGERVIKDGEWLSTIAEEYNMSWETLYHINKEKLGNDPNLIQPTDTLHIPLYTAFNLDNYIVNYKLEIWIFLCLFAVLIWIFYKKKPIKVNTVSAAAQPVEVKVNGTVGNYEKDSTTVSSYEVPIDVPNTVDFSFDKVTGEVSAENVEKNTAKDDLAKKLKKIKKG